MSNDHKVEQIRKQIHQHKDKIDDLLKQIDETENLKTKFELYEQVLQQNNTEEEYVLNYLICLKDLSLQDKSYKEKYEQNVKNYHICISDSNYDAHFPDIKRTNSKNKILSFFNLIRECKLETEDNKANTIAQIYFTFMQTNSIEFNNTKKITWDNKELYLYFLYDFLIAGVSEKIVFYNQIKDPEKIIKTEEFKQITDDIKKKEQDLFEYNKNKEKYFFKIMELNLEIPKLKAKQVNLLLIHAQYFQYIKNLKIFLNKVDANFKIRFKDLKLDTEEDKILFEKYMHFLSTYKFELITYSDFWNTTFVSLRLEEKKKIINIEKCYLKFSLSDDGTILTISDNEKKEEINTENYDLINFIDKAKYETDVIPLMWKKNKCILPTKYNKELFVYKTKQYWKKLLIHIFKSNVYIEARDSLFSHSQIDFFMIDDIISEIIENIRFFIYKTKFLGNTNKKTSTIYNYGNYDEEIKNKSIALLIFYGFHIIINIHEIGGHLNIRYQFFYTLNKEFSSPKIAKEDEELYSNYAKGKGKESGESIEIKLFGRVLCSITIKEALFILNEENYSLALNDFKEGFLTCNKKDINSLLSQNSKILLENLGINYDELNDNGEYYSFPVDRKAKETKVYDQSMSRHPFSYYYDKKELFEQYKEKYNRIYEILEKDPNANIFP